MKKIILAAMALAALAACNKAEVISAPEGEAIEFANPFVDNATKATDKTYSGDKALTAFYLYGTVTGTTNGTGTINIYKDCRVTGSIGAAVWTCPVNQYWINGADYNFAAVADGTVATDDNGMPKTITCNTVVTDNVQNDLLYATVAKTAVPSNNGYVNFVFDHLLAKAQFTVKSNTQGDYYYSVKNIQINNYVNGTYYVQDVVVDGNPIAAGTWKGTGDKANTAFGDIEDVRAVDATGKTCQYQRLLIPNTEAITVTFTVELWNANGDAADVKLSTEDKTFTVAQNLHAGNAYDFKIDLSVGELIQFTVTQKPTWNPAEGGTGVTLQ